MQPPPNDPVSVHLSDFADREFSGTATFDLASGFPEVHVYVTRGISSDPGFTGVSMSFTAEEMQGLVLGERVTLSQDSGMGIGTPTSQIVRAYEAAELGFDHGRRVISLTIFLGEAYGTGVLDDGRTTVDLAPTATLRLEGVFGVGCSITGDGGTGQTSDPTWSTGFCSDALTTYGLGAIRDFFAVE